MVGLCRSSGARHGPSAVGPIDTAIAIPRIARTSQSPSPLAQRRSGRDAVGRSMLGPSARRPSSDGGLAAPSRPERHGPDDRRSLAPWTRPIRRGMTVIAAGARSSTSQAQRALRIAARIGDRRRAARSPQPRRSPRNQSDLPARDVPHGHGTAEDVRDAGRYHRRCPSCAAGSIPRARSRANHEAMAALVADLRARQARSPGAAPVATSARSSAIASAASCPSGSGSSGCSTRARRFSS